MGKLAIGQVIIINRGVITQKKSLVTTTPSIKYDQVMRKIYNIEL